MRAVAAQNARVADPVYHVVLSWPSGEKPSDDQAFACGAHVLESIGMSKHQFVLAIHRDTENVHMHIAVNRVHPESFRSVYPTRDFYKLDRAMRELEIRFGWRHDKGSFAVFTRNGRRVIDWASAEPDTKGHQPTGARDLERHGDQESLFTYTRGTPRRDIDEALKAPSLTWERLHSVLARHGLQLRTKGQGFAVYETSEAAQDAALCVKASDMHPGLSKPKLVARLGTFLPAAGLEPGHGGYDRYRPPLRDPLERETRRQERADARRELKARYKAYLAGHVSLRIDSAKVLARYREIRARARERRLEVRNGIADRATRKAQYSIIAFETARELARLRQEVHVERTALRQGNLDARPTYRQWVEQQAARGDEAAIGQLRGWSYSKRRAGGPAAGPWSDQSGVCGFVPDAGTTPISDTGLLALEFSVLRDGSVRYPVGRGGDHVIESSDFIQVVAGQLNDRVIAVAMLLAARRYQGKFSAVGGKEFNAAVRRLGRIDATELQLSAFLEKFAHDSDQAEGQPRKNRQNPTRL